MLNLAQYEPNSTRRNVYQQELGRASLIPGRRKRNANNFVPMIVAEDRGFDRQ